MGTKHLSAIEISVYEEVVAAIILGEENGRMSVFEDGEYDDYQRDELGGKWRPRTDLKAIYRRPSYSINRYASLSF